MREERVSSQAGSIRATRVEASSNGQKIQKFLNSPKNLRMIQ
jgi:hypothetical protein